MSEDGKDYAVGKGKPPAEHRFKKGNKASRGRKPGSRNKSDLEKLLDSKVTVGHDTLGRPIRKKLREAIDRKLVQAALDGDLKAIRMIQDYELSHRALELKARPAPPSPEEMREAARLEEDKERASSTLVKAMASMLDIAAALKRAGMIDTQPDGIRLTPKGDAILRGIPEEEEDDANLTDS